MSVDLHGDQSQLEQRASPARRPRVIGLAGGVASGKSTVARMFQELGALVIDADAIAHTVLESAPVTEMIRRHWGAEFVSADGRPDRRKIGDVVFRQPARLAELNGWVHPAVREKMKIAMEKGLQDSGISFIIIDAPLLVEAELDAWCDDVLFIEASPSQRNERARARRGWPNQEVERRESTQASLTEKRRRATAVIVNSGSQEETFAQVRRLVQDWMQVSPSNKPQHHLSGGKSNG